jgi:hypothetical protein
MLNSSRIAESHDQDLFTIRSPDDKSSAFSAVVAITRRTDGAGARRQGGLIATLFSDVIQRRDCCWRSTVQRYIDSWASGS